MKDFVIAIMLAVLTAITIIHDISIYRLGCKVDMLRTFIDVTLRRLEARSKMTVRKALEAVPSADRPQGEWNTEYHGNGWNDYLDYTCSNCGKKYERADAVLYNARYCPNCGAKMKGADDEVR